MLCQVLYRFYTSRCSQCQIQQFSIVLVGRTTVLKRHYQISLMLILQSTESSPLKKHFMPNTIDWVFACSPTCANWNWVTTLTDTKGSFGQILFQSALQRVFVSVITGGWHETSIMTSANKNNSSCCSSRLTVCRGSNTIMSSLSMPKSDRHSG